MAASKPVRVNPIRVKPIRQFQKYISELRRRVAQSDASAMCDLGMWLQDGFQDRKGRLRLHFQGACTGRSPRFTAPEEDSGPAHSVDANPPSRAREEIRPPRAVSARSLSAR